MNLAPPPRRTPARKTGQRERARPSEPIPDAPTTCPRLYAIHPLMAGPVAGWRPLLAHAASLGFDHIACPPPFASARSSNIFLIDDPDHGDARVSGGDGPMAVRAMAAAAKAEGLGLILDVGIDCIVADGTLARGEHAWIAPSAGSAPGPDPRTGDSSARRARIDLGRPEAAAWWIARLTAWAKAGVAGFLLREAHRAPPGFWRAAIRAVRQAATPDLRFLAWIPGAGARTRRCGWPMPGWMGSSRHCRGGTVAMPGLPTNIGVSPASRRS